MTTSPCCTALVVEDETFVRMHVVDALETAGWVVKEAHTGERALALLEGDPPALDLLVTDIRLGGGADGWAVAKAFREKMPKLGVVYASGNVRDTDRQVPDSLFLAKPIRVDALLNAAAKVCDPQQPTIPDP